MSRTDFNTLLEAGAHFGHLKRKWNPKTAPYIFMEKNGIHIIDLHKTVIKIDEAAAVAGKVQDVLLEVNVSGEESKGGLAPGDVRALLDVCARLPHVRVRGLMTMAPQGDPAAARAVFEGLANLHAQLRAGLDPAQAALFDGLSMGMSEDWREAVRAGATIVRIGRAVFDDAFEA